MGSPGTKNLIFNHAPPVQNVEPHAYQTVTANAAPMTRHETLEGRQYMVVPMVMLTEGVHAGSNGPLYYPRNELAKTPAIWNHKPVVVYHPTQNGAAISACEPAVIQSRKVGLIMNARFEPGKGRAPGRLKAEAWLETNRLGQVDDRVLEAVQNKQMVEVSTGLFTDNEYTPGHWNGEKYVAIATNYRADHLAILPDEKGACSIADGAGLMRNVSASGSDADHAWAREDHIIDPSKIPGIHKVIAEKIKKSATLPSGLKHPVADPWVKDVYPTFAIFDWAGRTFQQPIAGHTTYDGVRLTGKPVPVKQIQRAGYTVMNSDTAGNDSGGEEKDDEKGRDDEGQEDTMTKNEIVATLIANRRTAWTEADRATLNSFPVDALAKMLPLINDEQGKGGFPLTGPSGKGRSPDDVMEDGHDDDNSMTIKQGPTATLPNGVDTGRLQMHDVAGSYAGDNGMGGDVIPSSHRKGGTQNMVQNNQAPQTVEQFITNAPAPLRDALTAMHRSHNAQKATLVQGLVANANCRFKPEYLMQKPLEELQALSALAGGEKRPQLSFNYSGLGDAGAMPAPVNNEEPLAIPAMTFNKREN